MAGTGNAVALTDWESDWESPYFGFDLPKKTQKLYTEEDYYGLPENVRAELINGIFYSMAPPSSFHQEIVRFLIQNIGVYIDAHQGKCRVFPAPFGVKLFPKDQKTVVEPDVSVICDQSKITEKGCSGAPDWVIEIVSPSSIQHDYVRKTSLYLHAGVREYWIVNPMEKTITIYHLETENFQIFHYSFQDRVKAGIYEDLWIDFRELRK